MFRESLSVERFYDRSSGNDDSFSNSNLIQRPICKIRRNKIQSYINSNFIYIPKTFTLKKFSKLQNSNLTCTIASVIRFLFLTRK